MPSNLIEPTGMAPARGDETFSPLRRSRNESGERVAGGREVSSGPVMVGYDGSPEAAALVRRAAACADGARVIVVHAWRSLNNPRDTAVALRACVHPHAVRRVLEAAREHDAEARAAAERIVAAGVALAQESGAEASGVCVAMTPGRGVTEALSAQACEAGAGAVVVGVRPRRGWRRLLGGWDTAGALERCLDVPVLAVPLTERESG
jgi:nucleotide-binding universal stress UspA family protein